MATAQQQVVAVAAAHRLSWDLPATVAYRAGQPVRFTCTITNLDTVEHTYHLYFYKYVSAEQLQADLNEGRIGVRHAAAWRVEDGAGNPVVFRVPAAGSVRTGTFDFTNQLGAPPFIFVGALLDTVLDRVVALATARFQPAPPSPIEQLPRLVVPVLGLALVGAAVSPLVRALRRK